MDNKGNTRTTWLIILVLYLVLVTVALGFIGNTFGDTKALSASTGVSFIDNVIVGIGILPSWINLVMFIIPAGILAYILFVNSTPTTNAGA